MKKSFTLVEVLVAFTILMLTSVVVLSTFAVINNIKKKEIEYLYFETICKDIDKYYDKYPTDWSTKYFSSCENNVVYYDALFVETSSEDAVYSLSFEYNSDNELVLSIYTISNQRYIIKELNYGARS